VDGLFYAPFDVPLAVRRVVSTVRPDVLVVVETEIWPNLLHYVAASGARLALVNARISDRSFEPYRKLRRVMGPALQRFDRILARTATDAERLQAIGAPAERLEVAGNVKFDQAGGCMEAGERLALRSDLGLPAGSPVFVVGSTREAAEEDIVLAAYLKAREQVPELALIYAPRHIERASELAQKMALAGLHPVRRTQAGTSALPLRQLILDTYGELGRVYAVADVAFLGNSLTPPGGGQNLVQPLAQGVPVLFGPYVQNFRDVAELARAEAVGFRVEDAGSLASQVVRLVQDATTRAKIGERAVRLVESNRGVAARCAEAICELAVNGRK
jgi:3-deoxy-D-manno-octulosonic-acid transferase